MCEFSVCVRSHDNAPPIAEELRKDDEFYFRWKAGMELEIAQLKPQKATDSAASGVTLE